MLSSSTFRYTRRFHNTPLSLKGGKSSNDNNGGTGWKIDKSSLPSAGGAYDNKEFQEHDYLSEDQKKAIKKLKEEVEEHIEFDPSGKNPFSTGKPKIKDQSD